MAKTKREAKPKAEATSSSKERRIIQPKALVALDPSQPSLAMLGNDVIIMILQVLQALHPKSMANVRLVSSDLNHLAEYVSYSVLKLNLAEENAGKIEKHLDHVEKRGLCPAVRSIEVTAIDDICDCSSCATSSDPKLPTESVLHFRRLLGLMTGLRDIQWPNGQISHATLTAMRHLPNVRLHARWVHSYQRIQQLDVRSLEGNSQLHSLHVQETYRGAKDCLEITQPLKKILLSCPNLRSLTLNIAMPQGGCVRYSSPTEYCGIGFVNGERPPALERLLLIHCPLGTPSMPGYPGIGAEADYWAEVFDWSRLKYLQISNALIALTLMPKLTALEEVEIAESWWPEKVAQFCQEVQPTLKRISVQNKDCITMEGVLRHGATLRGLQVHQNEFWQDKWSEGCISDESLIRIRDSCPLIEELRLNVNRRGEWPHSTLRLLGSFPRLRRLTLWFELGMSRDKEEEGVAEPKVTFSAVQWMFGYLRTHAPTQPSRLEELRVFSGSPSGIVRGRPSPMAFWPQHNSMQFLCRLSVRDDEASQGHFTCECPVLSKEGNEVLRGERAKLEKSKPVGLMDYDTRYEDERLRVAMNGPESRETWQAHY